MGMIFSGCMVGKLVDFVVNNNFFVSGGVLVGVDVDCNMLFFIWVVFVKGVI